MTFFSRLLLIAYLAPLLLLAQLHAIKAGDIQTKLELASSHELTQLFKKYKNPLTLPQVNFWQAIDWRMTNLKTYNIGPMLPGANSEEEHRKLLKEQTDSFTRLLELGLPLITTKQIDLIKTTRKKNKRPELAIFLVRLCKPDNKTLLGGDITHQLVLTHLAGKIWLSEPGLPYLLASLLVAATAKDTKQISCINTFKDAFLTVEHKAILQDPKRLKALLKKYR